MNSGELIYANKFAHELTRDEAIECALHFRDAYVESLERCSRALRRMTKMAEALTPEEIRRLDKWLDHHAHDAKKGDGTDLWPDWQTYR